MNLLTHFSSFFIILFMTSLSHLSSEVIPYKVCSKKRNTKYVVDEIEITETNQGYQISVYGTPLKMIECGNIRIEVSTFGATLYKKKLDLCDYTECPLAINEPSMISLSVNQSLPIGIYNIRLRMDTKCDKCRSKCGLGCVEFQYTIS